MFNVDHFYAPPDRPSLRWRNTSTQLQVVRSQERVMITVTNKIKSNRPILRGLFSDGLVFMLTPTAGRAALHCEEVY
jgi:hypothetical protein